MTMEEKKVKVSMELDKDVFQAFCFMMGEKLTDELWSKLQDEENAINVDEMGEEAQQIKLAFSAFAIAMVADKK